MTTGEGKGEYAQKDLIVNQTVVILCLMSLIASIFVNARPVPFWDYDRLFEESDIVVIVEPVSIRDAVAEDKLAAPNEDLVGTVTSFKIVAVAKGSLPERSLDIKHFVLKPIPRINAPQVISFKEAIRHNKESASWMN